MDEVQVTTRLQHHQLTNAQVWSADGQSLVYDLRPAQHLFTSQCVEKIHVETGKVTEIYRASKGAHVGVITAHPQINDRFVCIHGPESPDDEWHYDVHHRRGVILSSGKVETLDACDITPPFTLGALRGGSHVHMFSQEGDRISFTYNDHVMRQRAVEEDQRNVAIALPYHPVTVLNKAPREHDGSHFCVVVSQTTLAPQPGSDQISRAFEEGWIGHQGYINELGERQRWALAFIGETVSVTGHSVPEIFIVDLPDDFTAYQHAGDQPIEGTERCLPAPPAGIVQRRLTFSDGVGVALQPRHWLRSSPDGRLIAFLMADLNDIIQLWVISPNGGLPQQSTQGYHDVQSAFTWHPLGKAITFVLNNQIVIYDLTLDTIVPLTTKTSTAPCAEAVVWSPKGDKIAFMRDIGGFRQIFTVTTTELYWC
ncbi:WD40-like Beta Propeller Repeat [Rosenbergiella nectarea]|uniref:WD40-like Beta Propeller Repeat n=1 Tax=Rosenbergiella nectarea TaxID=988801 RepID=A0A1H9KY36_9GAMM|nr:DUF3748 domain-containing protein [Rosenbergiella nectarea]SER04066.1 WD40-like Beta Propeller Repeat [Rosenbergiella nectarea]